MAAAAAAHVLIGFVILGSCVWS